MTGQRILGIDPGLSGALALLTSGGDLYVVDVPILKIERDGKSKRQADVHALAAVIRTMAPSHAVIERVGAMPKQGVSSMFAFGRVVGQIEGVLVALEVPMTLVTPVTWRRAFTVPAGKDASRLRASELLPRYAERWRLKKHDGRAEAALLALYGLTNLPALEAAE